MELLLYFIVIVVGLIAGGVVNSLADDLPLRRSPRLPRFVPDAKKSAIHERYETEEAYEEAANFVQADDEKRPPIAWLGITAFLTNNRESSDGSVKLGWRYPLTEILTVFLMLLTLIAVGDEPDVSDLQILFWLGYMAIFALITVIDIEHKLILFVVIIPSSLLAILDAIVTPTNHTPHIRDAFLGAGLGFLVFFIVYNGGFIFTYIMGKARGVDIKEVAFGYGDVMMAMFSGFILGWQALIFAMFITVFLGAFGAIAFLFTQNVMGKKYSAFTARPYGPYIVAGTIVVLLFGTEVGNILGGGV